MNRNEISTSGRVCSEEDARINVQGGCVVKSKEEEREKDKEGWLRWGSG